MVPATISSIIILFLYWRQKNEAKPHGNEHATVAAVRSELANLNARLDTLQKRFARS
jgi:uncharacterized protein YceH (UPF0502 family)